MKLSDDTVNVLKNFSGINQSLQFKTGNTLKTISPLRTIFVEATVSETFPKEFGIPREVDGRAGRCPGCCGRDGHRRAAQRSGHRAGERFRLGPRSGSGRCRAGVVQLDGGHASDAGLGRAAAHVHGLRRVQPRWPFRAAGTGARCPSFQTCHAQNPQKTTKTARPPASVRKNPNSISTCEDGRLPGASAAQAA